MHILFVSPAFAPFNGGGERYAGALAGHMARRGHRITVLTSAAVTEPELWQGAGAEVQVDRPAANMTVIRVPLRPLPGSRQGLLAWRKGMVLVSALPGTTSVLRRMAHWIPPMRLNDVAPEALEEPVDIVHGFNISWENAAVWSGQYAQRHGLPYVISPFTHLGTGPRDRVAFNSTMRHQIALMNNADAVLALTEAEVSGLRERGVLAPRVLAVGSGLDDIPELANTSVVETDDMPYVLFVGRSSADKGAMDAAQAIIRLRERGTAVRLVMIGRETTAFESFLDGLTSAQREGIVWLGQINDAQKHAYLDGSLALLLPSHSDSFGIVLLEAWAHGKPVIGANAGGIPCVIDDGLNGFLVPFGDVEALANAVQRLLDDAPLREQLGSNGRVKVSTQYNWDTVTEVVLDTYEAVRRSRMESRITASPTPLV